MILSIHVRRVFAFIGHDLHHLVDLPFLITPLASGSRQTVFNAHIEDIVALVSIC